MAMNNGLSNACEGSAPAESKGDPVPQNNPSREALRDVPCSFPPGLRWRCCRCKNPRLEESTALAWLVYAKIDLVSLILRGRAMQGNALFGGQLQRFGDQVDPLR